MCACGSRTPQAKHDFKLVGSETLSELLAENSFCPIKGFADSGTTMAHSRGENTDGLWVNEGGVYNGISETILSGIEPRAATRYIGVG